MGGNPLAFSSISKVTPLLSVREIEHFVEWPHLGKLRVYRLCDGTPYEYVRVGCGIMEDLGRHATVVVLLFRGLL